jgi:hypothetical protein
MSTLSVHDLQGFSTYGNKVRVPSGHTLDVEGKFKLPVYDNFTRPASAEIGELILNTSTQDVEVWTGFAWVRVGGGASTYGSEANPATSAKALVDVGIYTNGVYWIQPTSTSPKQQVYCVLDPAVDGGGWMIIANNSTDTSSWIAASGHIPRPTAYSPYVGSTGSNSYTPTFNFSINAQDMIFQDFYHVATTRGSTNPFEPTNWLAYVGHRTTVPVQIPTNQPYWAVDNAGTGVTRGTVNGGLGLGNKRVYTTASGSTNYTNTATDHGFGVLHNSTSVQAINGGQSGLRLAGSGGQYYPTYVSYWEGWISSRTYVITTFSFSDYQATNTGVYQGYGIDDWQDGSGMGDAWGVEGQGANAYRGAPSFIMIR